MRGCPAAAAGTGAGVEIGLCASRRAILLQYSVFGFSKFPDLLLCCSLAAPEAGFNYISIDLHFNKRCKIVFGKFTPLAC